MSDLSPTEVIILEEAGSVLGRVEREATLTVKALTSDIERRDAERELRLVRMEQTVTERLRKLQDGRDGKDGEMGLPGENGAVGPPGPPGEAIQGPPGEIPPVPVEMVGRIERALQFLAAPSPVYERTPEPPKPPEVHVSISNHIPRKGTEKTVVTKHDDKGRILEFERREG